MWYSLPRPMISVSPPVDQPAVLRHFSALATIAQLASVDDTTPTTFSFTEPMGLSDHPVFFAEYVDAEGVSLPLVLSEGQIERAALRQVNGKTVFEVPTDLGLHGHRISFHRAEVRFAAGAGASLLAQFQARFSPR